MTIVSIAKRIGVTVAALRVAAQRIIGRNSDRDPVILISIEGDEFVLENHGQSVAYDVRIQPIVFSGMMAKFAPVPVLSSFHSVQLLPTLSFSDEARYISTGPLSRRNRDIRTILEKQWSEANLHLDPQTSEQTHPISLRYRILNGWHFAVTADLVLRVGSGELSVRNIRYSEHNADGKIK